MISQESRRLAGILLVILPTVLYGGYFLLTQLISPGSGYMDNPLRQNLFRAGHAHAGVLLVLSLVALRYVDEARLKGGNGMCVSRSHRQRYFSRQHSSFPCFRRTPLRRTASSVLRTWARRSWRLD